MNVASDSNWEPDPELLAAYFDGEFEGRPELADMRARVEAWLEAHPGAKEEWAAHRKLRTLWQETTPAEPADAAWQETLARIQAGQRGSTETRRRVPWLPLLAAAACVYAVIALGWGIAQFRNTPEPSALPVAIAPKEIPPPQDEPVEVLPVADASEITVLRIDGADTATLVVGLLPVDGDLELADPGEVRIVHCRACPRGVVPHVRQGENRPMIYARADTD